ncbi:beta-ketoacyl synthase chain length factor [Uruburuella testudinis]|uniref:Beta-ketoacyl synthase chain length factor n=1 Tax=Uruburuella testudinis TaxID=1282863 RepID=A0ABY4DNU1_9NEIS|nr:beta-ketoacyl synthase chain length factor [Uruburuella testudinis]UOO80719.1 beta-ketoacyl synthase chain length factor [Uruburuella testudinis]
MDNLYFSFSVAAWRAVGSRMADEGQWRAWAADAACADNLPDYKPALPFLPAMQRRRLGVPARLVLDAAWNLAGQFPDAPLVYVSHDGEINRSFELWLSLLREHTVSPTSFGLSVHNALAGQWSMLRGDMSEHTALAVCGDGLEHALAEAYALLQEGAPRVLVVSADEPLQADYAADAVRAPWPYALAMVVMRGDEYRLSLMPSETVSDGLMNHYWGALDWIRFMCSDGLEHVQNYGKRRWLWQKQDAQA